MFNLPIPGSMVNVPVKSAWASKTVWLQIAGPIASVLAAWGLQLSPEQLVEVVMGIQTVQSVATWIIKTWFTKTVTPSSVK